MSRRHTAILLGLLAVGLGVVAAGRPTTGAGGFSELQRVELAGAGDLEVVMGLIERPGQSTGTKHYHPGGELGFVLEGAVSITAEGEPERTLEAGASFHQPAGEWHVVSTHDAGARTLVFRVLEKGQPMIVEVDAGHPLPAR